MVEFTWHEDLVPIDLPIRQIYGVLFVPDGRILLRREKGQYQLTGGKPLEWESPEQTLRREADEEINCKIGKPYYIGYQEVFDGEQRYAQVRYVAQITEIGPARPDTDRPCWIYGRELISPEHAIEILPYGDISRPLIVAALKAAQEHNLFTPQNLTSEILNLESIED